MTRTYLLVRQSGAASTAQQIDRIAEALQDNGFHPEVVSTTSVEHVTEVAAAAAPDDVVAPLGGDGTLALAAAGLVRSGAAMLPLPAGRGNDFIRALGLPVDTARVVAGPHELTERRLDVGMIGDRPFLGVASVGFDAEANAVANRSRLLRGPLVYTYGGVAALVSARPIDFTVRVDGGAAEPLRAWNLAVGNSGRYGGGLRVCPDASMDDGRLDLVTYEGRSRPHVAAAALLARPGHHLRIPGVRSRHLTSIHLDAARPLPVYADGDPVAVLPVDIRVVPRALRVLVPRLT